MARQTAPLVFLLLLVLASGCTAPPGTWTTTSHPTSMHPEPPPAYVSWRVGLNVTVVTVTNQDEGVPQVNQNCVIGEQEFGEDLLAVHANATAGGGNLVKEWILRIDVSGSQNRTILTREGPLPLSISYQKQNFTGESAVFSIRVLPAGSPAAAAQEKVNLELVLVTRNIHELNLERERILSCA